MRLSVIIPAYNEESRLPQTIKEINEYLRKQNYSYEILVVDDGSKDKTREAVESLGSEIRNLRVIGYKKNKGKGYAVRLGMLQVQGQYRLFIDADNSISIEQIEKFWPEFEKNFEIVIGSKVMKGAIFDSPRPWQTKILSGTFILLRKLILNLWEIKDTQTGFKCFKKEAAEKIFPLCKINGFAFDIEILILARRLSFNVKEVPVYCKHRPESKVGWRSMIKMALDLLKMKKIN